MNDNGSIVKCLYPQCQSETNARGLCRNHYHAARNLVIAGVTSWDKLEADGKIRHRQRNTAGKYSEWFLKEKKEGDINV